MLTLSKRSFGLDLIRAIAIILVVVSHFAHVLDPFGYWGVELFFGLSGFLIGQILWKNFSTEDNWTTHHLFNFWSRRWWRTLPNYYLFLVVSLFFYYFVDGHLPDLKELFRFFFFGQYLLSHKWGFYGISWSLCIEEWFYISFPIVIYLLKKLRLTPSECFLSAIAIFIVQSFIIRRMLMGWGENDSLRTITFARLDSITCGVTLAYVSMVLKPSKIVQMFLFAAGILLLATPIAYAVITKLSFHELSNNTFLLFLLPFGASLILPWISTIELKGGILDVFSVIVEKISLWSYSIYLSHIPLMWAIYHLMEGIRTTMYGNLLSKIVGLAVTLIVSSLIFKYWEMPFTRKRPKELRTQY